MTIDSSKIASIRNAVLNQKTISVTEAVDASDVARKLREMGLSLPRQLALFKRAITGADVNGAESLSGTIDYEYRGLKFRLAWVASPAGYQVTRVDLL